MSKNHPTCVTMLSSLLEICSVVCSVKPMLLWCKKGKGKGILVSHWSTNGHFYPILCSRWCIEYTLPSCMYPCTAGDGAEESATSGDRTWNLSIGSQTALTNHLAGRTGLKCCYSYFLSTYVLLLVTLLTLGLAWFNSRFSQHIVLQFFEVRVFLSLLSLKSQWRVCTLR